MVKFHLYVLLAMDQGFASTIRSDQVVEFAGQRNVLITGILTFALIAREGVCVNMAKSGITAMFAIQIDHQKKDVSMVKFHLHALHVMDLGFVSTIGSDQVVEFAGLSL